MARNTPSAVLYKDLKGYGITNQEAARALFDTQRKIGGGKTVGTDLESRPRLSTHYVKVAPGMFDEDSFRPFSRSAQDIAGRLLGNPKNSLRELEAHYTGAAAGEMVSALAACGIETAPYENALVRIENGDYHKPEGRFLLALMLFIICGCLGDPKRAVVLEEEFAEDWLGASVRTVTAEPGSAPAPTRESGDAQLQLGIVQINLDGSFPEDAALHVLPQTSEGAILGSGASDIADVGPHVSRRHARIYFEEGRWLIIGLKSTNGTSLIGGADGVERVVEPPKSQRRRGYVPQPVEIGPADIICLADDTRFVVRMVETA